MDFYEMKRKDLQALCKKHGIPGNLKNSEMATRLSSVFEKETEETLADAISLSEDSVEADGVKDDLVVKEAKKVRFSPENEVFEFTRSVKRCQRKNVRTLSKGINVQEGGIEFRRSKRNVAKGKTVAGSNEIESSIRRGRWSDVTEALKVPRRSKRVGSSGSGQEDCKVTELMALEQFQFEDMSEGLSGSDQDGFKLEKIGRRLTSKARTLLPAKRSKRLEDKEGELVKNNVKVVLHDDPKFEKFPRRSRRSANDIDVQTNTQDQRRSIRLKARAANTSMGGESSDGRPLCSAKESKEQEKTKQSKIYTVVNSQEGELVKNKTMEPLLIDSEVQTIENHRIMKVQDVSKVGKVLRRSKRLGNINVLVDKKAGKAVNREKNLRELLVDGQVQKGDIQPKRTSGNDHKDRNRQQSSKHIALDNMIVQAMNNSLKRCSDIDCEQDGASVDNVKKANVKNEMQASVRYTRNSSRHDLFEAPIEVKRNLIEKNTDETLDSLVKSSKRVTRSMKRDRSAEPGMYIETASTQSNQTPKKSLDEYAQFEQEEGGGANVEAIGSSKKSKTMNQECVEDKSQGMIEESHFSSETKAAASVMITENVLESTLEKSVDSSQRINIKELNSELMEEERVEKLEQDTVLMSAIEEDKEEVSSRSILLIERLSPTSVQLAVSNCGAALVMPTCHILVKDIASTAIAEENTKTKDEPLLGLKEHRYVEVLENSAECWNEIQSSKDGEKGSLKKTIQAENLHGNFSEYNTENSKVDCISVSHCVNLEMLDEVKNDSLEKSEQRSSCEKGCKHNALELRRWLSTDFTSHSLEENKVSKCFEEEEIKSLSQPLPRHKNTSAFDELAIFATPERNLMLMEQVSENGKTLATDSVIHHNDEAVESHNVVFTAPIQSLLLRDAGTDEAGKEEEHTATDFPDESDVLNTTEKVGGSRQTEARNEGKSIAVELHGESGIATSLEKQFSVGDSKRERIGMNEENRTVELHCEPGTCTSPDGHTLLGNYESDEAGNSEGQKAMELYEESVVLTGLERHELFGSFGQDKVRESEGKKVVQFYEESGVSTGLHRDQSLADSELNEAGWQGFNSRDKSGLFTSLEKQKRSVKTGGKAAAEFHDGSAVSNVPASHPFPEDSELDEAATSEEDKVVELQVDCGIFTTAEKHLLLETDEGVKRDNITVKSVVSDILAAAEPQSLMGDSEPDEAEKTYREIKDVELLGESNFSTNPERHILFGNSELDETIDYSAATCAKAFVFTSPERQLLTNSEPYSDGMQEQKEVDDSVSAVQESHVAAPDFRENTIVHSSCSITSKVSYNHGLNAGQETAGAELMPKGSQAEDDVGLDATQGTSKKSREHSVNLFDFGTKEAETIMETERNASFSSYVSLPAKGNSETVDEISSYLEVTGTCSMVSEESGPSTDIQNQIHDALEGLAVTDNNEADKLIEAKVTKNIQKGFEGNLMLNSSGGSYDSGKTCILAGTENEDEAAGPIATTAFEKTISLTPDEFAIQNNMNEKAADEEMIKRETTPSPVETLDESSVNKEYLNIDEIGMLSEMQVRREPSLIYRTQVKPKKHDMKENAPNSKIVHNLNVTAPRTSKRQPLQDLSKN